MRRCDKTAAKEYRKHQGVPRKEEEQCTEEKKILFWHSMLRRYTAETRMLPPPENTVHRFGGGGRNPGSADIVAGERLDSRGCHNVPARSRLNICSRIACQLQVGTSLGRRRNYIGPMSNPRPVLDSSAQTTRGKELVFCKT